MGLSCYAAIDILFAMFLLARKALNQSESLKMQLQNETKHPVMRG